MQIIVVDFPFVKKNPIPLIVVRFQLFDLFLMFVDQLNLLVILFSDLEVEIRRAKSSAGDLT